MKRFFSSRGTWIVGTTLVLVVVAGLAMAWSRFEVMEESYDPSAASAALRDLPEAVRSGLAEELDEQEATDASLPDDVDDEPFELPSTRNPHTISPPLPDDMFDATLLIGTDESRLRADAILYFLDPTDGSPPILVSIPRDLFIENPCTETYARINATLRGCGDVVPGPALLSLTVERFTGVKVDRFVLVDFDGFEQVIDALGGVDHCFDHPLLDRDADLEVDAGCQRLDGATALAFARSRKTLEFRDGAWRGTGADDFSRQEHQQEILFAVADRISSFRSITRLVSIADTTSEAVRISENFSVAAGVAMAWEHRSLRVDDVARIRLETKPYVTSYGAYVLEPTAHFNTLLADAYPPAGREVVAGD